MSIWTIRNTNPSPLCQFIPNPRQSKSTHTDVSQRADGTSTIGDRPKCLNRGRFDKYDKFSTDPPHSPTTDQFVNQTSIRSSIDNYRPICQFIANPTLTSHPHSIRRSNANALTNHQSNPTRTDNAESSEGASN